MSRGPYELYKAADSLAEYLDTVPEDINREEVMHRVHRINAEYVNWAYPIDKAGVEEVE